MGTWAAFLLFGGEFPSPDITSRLFVVHILLVPGRITAERARVGAYASTRLRNPAIPCQSSRAEMPMSTG